MRIIYDRHLGEHVVEMALSADELEATAYAFGPTDGVFTEYLGLADELRALDGEAGAMTDRPVTETPQAEED